MALFRRLGLFLLLNIVVVMTLSMVTRLLGLDRAISARGFDPVGLMGWALVWGMGGALISLMLSRMMARYAMGVVLVEPGAPRGAQQAFLVATIRRLAAQAGLPQLPQVGIYEAEEINAFATGPSRSRSLVAVSSGLLRSMNEREAEAVLAHEISHIANGDMVTMTLLQGVVNAFAMFAARALAWAITQGSSRDREDRGGATWMSFALEMVFQMVFLFLGSMLVAWFSRWREYRADAGGARLAGKSAMIQALQRLAVNAQLPADGRAQGVEAMQISGRAGRLLGLLASHPPLQERIERLELAGHMSASGLPQ